MTACGAVPGNRGVAVPARREGTVYERRMGALLVCASLIASWPQFAAGGGGPNAPVADYRLSAAPARISSAATPDAVLRWNKNAGEAAIAACLAPIDDPLHESRIDAMMHIAIHDALNAIDRRSEPYAYDAHAPTGTSPDAAVAAAGRTVLETLISELPADLSYASCIANGISSTEAAYRAALAMIPDGPATNQGIALGEAAARAILDLRAADGAVGPFLNHNCSANPPSGVDQCTPATPLIALEVWNHVTPFVLRRSSQFRPGPPYPLTSKKYAADLNEVKSLGGDGITTPSLRIADQTESALFWYESSPLKWNRIARTVSLARGLDLWENARLFGLLDIALADGYIAMVDTKNHYAYGSPVTAIQEADTDGNPRTTGDSTWTPLRATPADQDYASGQSIEGGAGAEVLKQYFGTDWISFEDCSTTLPAGSTCVDPAPVLRMFSTFTQAANEDAESRILIGFHFRQSVLEGTACGRKIGRRAVNLNFRLVH
jgi:hypothetical protein